MLVSCFLFFFLKKKISKFFLCVLSDGGAIALNFDNVISGALLLNHVSIKNNSAR